MFNRQSVFFVALEIILIVFAGIALWQKILLPIAYYLVATILAALIIAQMLTKSNSRSLVLQIALLYLFLNSVYYLATNYRVIPFWDGNWDFAVVETFIEEEKIFLISGQNPSTSILSGYNPARMLPTYSGWPFLHSLAFSLSKISGIDAFHISMALPPIISIISFLFVYLIVEKARSSLGLDSRVTNFALLIYATSADALFWQIQFVRQNLGTMTLYIMMYTFYLSITNPTHSRKLIHQYFGRKKIGREKFSAHRNPALLTFETALLMSTFLFFWWNYYETTIWRHVGPTLTRFLEVLSGARQFAYTPTLGHYPGVLTPLWATSLLRLRDILIYIPSIFGLFLIMFRKKKTQHELFVMFSPLAFGLLAIINNFSIRVETFRIIMLALPVVALLSATFFSYFVKKVKGIWRTLSVTIVLGILILASFVGLWGHSFAPMHLYDPSVRFSEVGERNSDFMRVNDFFSQKIQVTHFDAIWVDDDAPLVLLLEPSEYNRILRLESDYIQTHSSKTLSVNELVCEFSDLNLYRYYAGKSSFVTPEQGETFQYELNQYFESSLARIYDDGKYRFWVNEAQ